MFPTNKCTIIPLGDHPHHCSAENNVLETYPSEYKASIWNAGILQKNDAADDYPREF